MSQVKKKLPNFERMIRTTRPPHLRTRAQRKARITMDLPPGMQNPEGLKKLAQESNKKMGVIAWSTNLMKAAYLIAEDRMSLDQIIADTGISKVRLNKYLRATEGEFFLKIEEFRKKIIDRIYKRGIANREVRINVLDELHTKLREIVQQRADKYKNRKHPGVNTGLMVRTVKAVGHGKSTKIVRGWGVDTALTREIREVQLQVAKETGQLTEKHETANLVLIREYQGADTANV